MQRFTELRVWQFAHLLMVRVYRETRGLPHDEIYGIRSQLRRASLSICTNIAEGSKKKWNTDYARMLNVAESSSAECEALVMACRDLGFFTPEVAADLLNAFGQTARMLHALRLKCEAAANEAPRHR